MYDPRNYVLLDNIQEEDKISKSFSYAKLKFIAGDSIRYSPVVKEYLHGDSLSFTNPILLSVTWFQGILSSVIFKVAGYPDDLYCFGLVFGDKVEIRTIKTEWFPYQTKGKIDLIVGAYADLLYQTEFMYASSLFLLRQKQGAYRLKNIKEIEGLGEYALLCLDKSLKDGNIAPTGPLAGFSLAIETLPSIKEFTAEFELTDEGLSFVLDRFTFEFNKHIYSASFKDGIVSEDRLSDASNNPEPYNDTVLEALLDKKDFNEFIGEYRKRLSGSIIDKFMSLLPGEAKRNGDEVVLPSLESFALIKINNEGIAIKANRDKKDEAFEITPLLEAKDKMDELVNRANALFALPSTRLNAYTAKTKELLAITSFAELLDKIDGINPFEEALNEVDISKDEYKEAKAQIDDLKKKTNSFDDSRVIEARKTIKSLTKTMFLPLSATWYLDYESLYDLVDDKMNDDELSIIEPELNEFEKAYASLLNNTGHDDAYVRDVLINDSASKEYESMDADMKEAAKELIRSLKKASGIELHKIIASRRGNRPSGVWKVRIKKGKVQRMCFLLANQMQGRESNSSSIFIVKFLVNANEHDRYNEICQGLAKKYKDAPYKENEFFLFNESDRNEGAAVTRRPECSAKQYRIASNLKGPRAVYGCAGSGKTLISLKKYSLICSDMLHTNNPKDKDIAYVTFIDGLTDLAKETLENDYALPGYAYSLCDYFRNASNLSLYYPNTHFHVGSDESQFRKWFIDRYENKEYIFDGQDSDIKVLDKWPELPRLVYTYYKAFYKGSNSLLEKDNRVNGNGLFPSAHLNEDSFISQMSSEKGYIGEGDFKKTVKALYALCEQYRAFLEGMSKKEKSFTTFISICLNKYDLRDIDTSLLYEIFIDAFLSDGGYVIPETFEKRLANIKTGWSSENKEKLTKEYYSLCLKAFWATVDDNDLALRTFDIRRQHRGKSVKYMIVDEVQDLTNVHIRALLETLENKTESTIFFYGDPHQTINPVVFDDSSLKTAISAWSGATQTLPDDDDDKLLYTYRTSKSLKRYLVGLVNNRKEWLGHYCDTLGEPDVDPNTEDNKNTWACYVSDEKLSRKLLESSFDSSKIAIIVPDERVREQMRAKFSLNEDQMDRIYTIYSAKGIEWDYCILYHMIGANRAYFEQMKDGIAKKSTIHRMYFNKYYVSCTRAIKNFIVVEDEGQPFEPLLSKLDLPLVDKLNRAKLYLEIANDAKSWIEEGKKNRMANNISSAQNAFRRAMVAPGVTLEERAEAEDLLRNVNNEYSSEDNKARALKYLVEEKNYSQAAFFFKIANETNYYNLCRVYMGEQLTSEEFQALDESGLIGNYEDALPLLAKQKGFLAKLSKTFRKLKGE